MQYSRVAWAKWKWRSGNERKATFTTHWSGQTTNEVSDEWKEKSLKNIKRSEKLKKANEHGANESKIETGLCRNERLMTLGFLSRRRTTKLSVFSRRNFSFQFLAVFVSSFGNRFGLFFSHFSCVVDNVQFLSFEAFLRENFVCVCACISVMIKLFREKYEFPFGKIIYEGKTLNLLPRSSSIPRAHALSFIFFIFLPLLLPLSIERMLVVLVRPVSRIHLSHFAPEKQKMKTIKYTNGCFFHFSVRFLSFSYRISQGESLQLWKLRRFDVHVHETPRFSSVFRSTNLWIWEILFMIWSFLTFCFDSSCVRWRSFTLRAHCGAVAVTAIHFDMNDEGIRFWINFFISTGSNKYSGNDSKCRRQQQKQPNEPTTNVKWTKKKMQARQIDDDDERQRIVSAISTFRVSVVWRWWLELRDTCAFRSKL